MSNPFTQAILADLMADPEAAATVREWVEYEADPEQRALRFAVCLEADYQETYGSQGRRCGVCVVDRLVDAALERVSWLWIAQKLLRRFGPKKCNRLTLMAEPSRN